MSVISARHVDGANGVLTIGLKDVITPLAADRAKELGIRIERAEKLPQPLPAPKSFASVPPAVRPASAAPAQPKSAAPAQPPQALSGALYRRGAPMPPGLRPDGGGASNGGDSRPSAAVVGAGHVGAMTALRLAETSTFSRIVLTDIVPGLAAGLALDMWHSASLRGFTTRIEGSTDLSAVAGADYIVVTAGRPRRPGMSRTDLTGVNAAIITAVGEGIRQNAPTRSWSW